VYTPESFENGSEVASAAENSRIYISLLKFYSRVWTMVAKFCGMISGYVSPFHSSIAGYIYIRWGCSIEDCKISMSGHRDLRW
jgi:hypothetical protein